MKIAVIGANGKSGRIFVEHALNAGHEVWAGARGKSTLPEHPRLFTVHCDVTDVASLRKLIRKKDAVVSLIGHVKNSPPDIQTTAMKNIVSVMNDVGVSQLVSLTGTGARMPGDRITLLDRLLNTAVKLVDAARVRDGIEHIKVLQNSSVNWTVIRVLKLENWKASSFVLRENGPAKTFVSRHEVAKAILQVLASVRYNQKAPIISPGK